jgi:WD40 repeat protein
MPFAKLKAISPMGARSIALSNTGRWLAVELENGHVEIRDLVMDRSSAFLDPVPAYVSGVSFFYPHLSFWAADTRFARVTQQADELVETVDIVLFPGPEHKRIRMTHKDKLNNFSLSSDGKLLSTSAWDGQIKLWDVMSGKEIHAFTGQLIAYISSAFSPDGSRLVAGAYDGSITLWDLSSFNQVGHWKAHANYAVSVWFLEGGNTLVTKGSPNIEFGNWETHIWRPPSFAQIEAAGMATPYRAEAK